MNISEQTSSIAPWRDLFKEEIARYSEVGLSLRGARYRENLSQRALAEQVGITQTNLSNMEHGKRPIGEKLAKRFAKVFGSDYRLFLTKGIKA